MTVSSNQSTDLSPDTMKSDLVFTVHRIVALSAVLRSNALAYADMQEVCIIPDKCFHNSWTLPPGELSIMAVLLFDLVYENYSDLIEATDSYLQGRKGATNGNN